MNQQTIKELKTEAYLKIFYGYVEAGQLLLRQAEAIENAIKGREIQWIG